jgi:hypothetical protein
MLTVRLMAIKSRKVLYVSTVLTCGYTIRQNRFYGWATTHHIFLRLLTGVFKL